MKLNYGGYIVIVFTSPHPNVTENMKQMEYITAKKVKRKTSTIVTTSNLSKAQTQTFLMKTIYCQPSTCWFSVTRAIQPSPAVQFLVATPSTSLFLQFTPIVNPMTYTIYSITRIIGHNMIKTCFIPRLPQGPEKRSQTNLDCHSPALEI